MSQRTVKPGRQALLALGLSLLGIQLAGGAGAADDKAQEIFRSARAYTVRIRTQITTPFFEDERGSMEGAGFLIDSQRGWVVTNAHVVGRSPSTVSVAFADSPYRPAHKVYVDPYADIAIIEVDALDRWHPVASLACGEVLEVGEPIGAFGHPLGLRFTGTRGIVSGRTDKFGPDFIQIDATVDHGNSGGPVLSLRDGQVVGIATAGATGSKADRLNFATPIRDVCRIADLLRAGTSPSPPHMAITLLRDDDDRLTLQVGLTNDARRWPLEPGDRIVGLKGGDSLATVGELVSALRGHDGSVPLEVVRNGRKLVVDVTPEPQPLLLDRLGLCVDGALIATANFEDGGTLRDPAPLVVHSIAPGSAAEMAGLQRNDILRTVDGMRFNDVDHLARYLNRRSTRQPITVVLSRWSEHSDRIFEYYLHELPGEDIQPVGPLPELSAATQSAGHGRAAARDK